MRTFFQLFLAAGIPCLLAHKISVAAEDAPAPQIAEIAKDYKKLHAMTPDRVFVDPGLAMLCRGASQRDVEEAQKKSGPHAHTSIRVYMNDLAAGAFKESAKAYPVGAVIVKEKSGLNYWSSEGDRKSKKTHDGVGGMVKRAPGFDPAHGDWEYFYFEDAAKIESGKIASCVACHAGAAGRDFVFGSWAAKVSK